MPEVVEEPRRAGARKFRRWLSLLGLAVLAAAAHWNGLSGALVFDDVPAVQDNATIRRLWPLAGPFSPPADTGIGGRPLANFSLAVNHAISGGSVRGYHAGNLLLHVGATLAFFGIVRRTLERHGPAAGSFGGWAGIAAALWCAHPLTTASVSYVSQRTELLMALLYLLALYGFIRGSGGGARGWLGFSIATCGLGMMSKEVMVTAPAAVLLYDRTFVAGSFGAALRQRWLYYVGLASTWLVLAWLMRSGLEQRSVGFGLGVSPLDYALTQGGAILIYLRQAFWPASLIFDYGAVYRVDGFAVLLAAGLVVVALRALRRPTAVGFLAAGFFLLLAPTSSFVPVAEQPIAENRMYLPLATLVLLSGIAVVRAFGTRRPGSVFAAAGLAVLALASLTVARNRVYASELALWSDTVRKRPENARALFNLAVAHLDANQPAEAARWLRRAIELKPREPRAHNSLGTALLELGRVPEAMAAFAEAIRLQPSLARAWYNYGTATLRQGDATTAIRLLRRAIELEPAHAGAHEALGNACFQSDQPAEAAVHYAAALRLAPNSADAHYNRGSACLELGRIEEAIEHFSAAARLKPSDAEIRNNLGAALVRAGRIPEAMAEFESALRLKPDYEDARSNLEVAKSVR